MCTVKTKVHVGLLKTAKSGNWLETCYEKGAIHIVETFVKKKKGKKKKEVLKT